MLDGHSRALILERRADASLDGGFKLSNRDLQVESCEDSEYDHRERAVVARGKARCRYCEYRTREEVDRMKPGARAPAKVR